MRTEYSVNIVECTKELSVKEKIMLKDFGNAVALDRATAESDSPIVVEVDYFARMEVHNEKSRQDKDYQKIVICDTAGNKYITGSDSLYNSLCDIYEELFSAGENGPFTVEIYGKPSANYVGKTFLTCSLC